jgi:hypothetical protein
MDEDAQGTARDHDELSRLLPFYELGTLPDPQRQALEDHALQCNLCFEALESAAPAMAALRADRQRALRALRDPAQAAARSRGLRVAAGRQAWLPWLMGGLAGAGVMAIAALLLLRPQMATTSPAASGQSGWIAPWVAPTNVRGASGSVTLTAGSRSLVLMLAVPAPLDRSQPVTIEVTGPAGSPMPPIPVAPSELGRSTLLVVLEAPVPLRSGTYRVRLRGGGLDGAGAAAYEWSFRVQIEQPGGAR